MLKTSEPSARRCGKFFRLAVQVSTETFVSSKKENQPMIRWAGMEILEEFPEVIDPKHTGLLLWNFSQEAVDRCFNGAEIVKNTKSLVARARERNFRIIYSKPGSVSWKSVGAPMIRMRMKQFRVRDPKLLKAPSVIGPGKASFAAGLEPRPDDTLFDQFLPNAFLGTCFEWWLRKYQLKTLILAGAFLETGIDGTARDALNLGYYTVIARDCVGSPYQDTYDAAMRSLERIFDIVDSQEIMRH